MHRATANTLRVMLINKPDVESVGSKLSAAIEVKPQLTMGSDAIDVNDLRRSLMSYMMVHAISEVCPKQDVHSCLLAGLEFLQQPSANAGMPIL